MKGKFEKIMKNKIWIGVVVLALLWIGNIIYFQTRVLDKPIFFKNYMDFQLLNNGISSGDIRLFYVTNSNSKENVSSIILPEISDESIGVSDFNWGNSNAHYKLKQINITLRLDKSVLKGSKEKILTKAIVNFSNGKVENVDIGKICLLAYDRPKSMLTNRMTGGSSYNTGYISFQAKKDIKIISIENKMEKDTKDFFKLGVEDKSFSDVKFPIELKQNEQLTLSYAFNFKKGDANKNNNYLIPLIIITEDSEGNRVEERCYANSNMPSLEYLDVAALKKAGGK